MDHIKRKARMNDIGRFFKRGISHDAQLKIMFDLEWNGMLPFIYLFVKSTQLFKLSGWAAQGIILGDEDDNCDLKHHPAYALLAPPSFVFAVAVATVLSPLVLATGLAGGAVAGAKAIDEVAQSKRI
jgi:hypothetical protein